MGKKKRKKEIILEVVKEQETKNKERAIKEWLIDSIEKGEFIDEKWKRSNNNEGQARLLSWIVIASKS